MAALIGIAYDGFKNFISYGKYPGIFMTVAVVVFLLLQMGRLNPSAYYPSLQILLYGLITELICVVPVTAVLLLLYQTRFYGPEWIFAQVPVTAGIAAGGTLVVDILLKWGRESRKQFSAYLAVFAMFMVLLAGGGMNAVSAGGLEILGNLAPSGNAIDKTGLTKTVREYAVTEEILEYLHADGDTVLYAPSEIMRYARSVSGEIGLLYGRDMFDPATGAYAFDEYDEELTVIYDWMRRAENTTDIRILSSADEAPAEALSAAVKRGANLVILPGNMSETIEAAAQGVLGVEGMELATDMGVYRIYDIR